ncbi:MAG: FecR domain-containing protein [Planctomycetota bacterium]|jgi:hypothetical protein|nr:FecR domain-containing protein [Planctomycetota bacterium]
MKFPSSEFDDAVAALCHGVIGDDAMTELHELLRDEPSARDEYLWRVEMHGELASERLGFGHSAAVEEEIEKPAESPPRRSEIQALRLHPRWKTAAAAAVALFALSGGLWMWHGSQPSQDESEAVARFAELRKSRWMLPSTQVSTGDVILKEQRIELSSGSAEVEFKSGARMTLSGPTILEALSSNSVFLLLGQARLVAEMPESKGFTVITRNSKFVEIGTAFTATVAPDGLSRLEVSKGEVDVVLKGIKKSRRLKAGETLYVEPGERKIVTRIEPGDGTAAFRFPTIEPPSHDDYADQASGHATIRVARGELKNRPGASGEAMVLLDGLGQSRQDAPRESAFFRDRTEGSLLVDLGRTISVTRINSYSWHQHHAVPGHRHRARQRFTLYGYSGEEVPDLNMPPEESGWVRVARVNTDRFFRVNDLLDRPSQQASSITAARGEIGRFRYLLWEVKRNTFFGEFDVYGKSSQSVD